MRLIERIGIETQLFQQDMEDEISRLLDTADPVDYQRYLVQTYGFVLPVERAIAATSDTDRAVEPRRFRKHQLLRRDLEGFRMTAQDIDRVPLCPVPRFGSAEEALGWAYVIERGTLEHTRLFRHLAGVMPGVVAFSAAYLKCYFGGVGEAWNLFGDLLDAVAHPADRAERVIQAAGTAFRAQRAWRRGQDDHEEAEQLRA